ncbi:hypothetical protein [Pseudoxanthomonas sp.]|uniref:hypothetical protein n=1 Tax=Pseudoxanthomonas sp. TaxID=1871049 RepID=UPI002E131ED6|nr:hypothetical protein [Pseudoxanthomonas sp.]
MNPVVAPDTHAAQAIVELLQWAARGDADVVFPVMATLLRCTSTTRATIHRPTSASARRWTTLS